VDPWVDALHAVWRVFEQTCLDREARQVGSPSPPGLVADPVEM
jgi:hypothetical protein